MLYIAGFRGFIHFARVAVDNFCVHRYITVPLCAVASVCFLAVITMRHPWGLRGTPIRKVEPRQAAPRPSERG